MTINLFHFLFYLKVSSALFTALLQGFHPSSFNKAKLFFFYCKIFKNLSHRRQQSFFVALGLFYIHISMCTIFPLGVLYPEHSQLAFLTVQCVVIVCSLESIRPGLVQGCKDPNGVGQACCITSLDSGLPLLNMVCTS